ncbi:MAG: HAD family phosphatase [Bacteroidota bacterium]|nr:HAD family phosphatase [Bacteroidota bacterium]
MKIGVLFDMDGVIIDSNPFHKIALDIFLEKYGFNLSEEERKKKLYGRANKDWINEVFGGGLTEARLLELGSEKEMYWRDVYKNDIKPVKGLVQFLDLLKFNEIPIAIGTSAPPENVEFTLEKCQISSYFKVILNQDHVIKGKPDPEIYLNCAKSLNLPSSQCIVIEDSLAGVAAGKAAGCKVIGITTTHTKAELSHCDMIIEDFKGLEIEHLKSIF